MTGTGRGRKRRALFGCALAVALAVHTLACGGSPTSPTPSPTPTPTNTPTPPEQTVTLSGTVTTAGAPVQNARVDIISVLNSGRSTMTDAAGKYRLTDLKPGTLTIRVSATDYAPQTSTFTLSGDGVSDINLLPMPSSGTSFAVVDVLFGSGIDNVVVTIPGGSTVSDPGGGFLSQLPAEGAATRSISLARAGSVSRESYLQHAEANNRFSMIPSSFNLAAFDEIARRSPLRRWTTSPKLVIENCTLTYVSTTASSSPCSSDGMTDAEYSSMVTDLEWSLPQLSGQTFGGFSSITRQQSPNGSSVLLLNFGQITVARIAGLTTGSTFWGYGRYFITSNWTITAGIVMIDRDFDRSGSPFRRSLRAHELGHAMGYDHSSLTSVMNSSARTEPTAFDLDVFRIAFRRPLGNRTPDVDPNPDIGVFSTSAVAGWSAPIR